MVPCAPSAAAGVPGCQSCLNAPECCACCGQRLLSATAGASPPALTLLPASTACCSPTRPPTHPPAVGDTIPINYNNKRYFIDIIEAKPGQAISVIETDCNVSGSAGRSCCCWAPPLSRGWPARGVAAAPVP